jgi:hypothetical protein
MRPRVTARTVGPLVPAGHAYAGAVIAAADDARVKSLVYIAALAPEEGETLAQVFYRDGVHPQAPRLAPDKDGFIWMPEEGRIFQSNRANPWRFGHRLERETA